MRVNENIVVAHLKDYEKSVDLGEKRKQKLGVSSIS